MTKTMTALGLVLTALTACSGSGDDDGPLSGGPGDQSATIYNDLTDTTVTTDTDVRTISIDLGGRSTEIDDAVFNHATSSFGPLGSVIVADGTGITAGLSSVMSIPASSAGVAGDIRLIAQQTALPDLPTGGSFTYSGTENAQVNVTDNVNAYDAVMDATITADFSTTGSSAQTVDVMLTNATDVTQTQISGGVIVPYAGSNEAVSLNGLVISGNEFADGTGTTASATGWDGGTANLIQGTQTISAAGVFAGDEAQEVAGVGIAEGASSGSLTVVFAGSQ